MLIIALSLFCVCFSAPLGLSGYCDSESCYENDDYVVDISEALEIEREKMINNVKNIVDIEIIPDLGKKIMKYIKKTCR